MGNTLQASRRRSHSLVKLSAALAIGFTALLLLHAAGAGAAPVALSVPSSVEAPNAVPFSVSAAPGSRKVELLVDGKRRWTTRAGGRAVRRSGVLKLKPGRHAVAIKAVRGKGRVSVKRQVTVVQEPATQQGHQDEEKPSRPVTSSPPARTTTPPATGGSAPKTEAPAPITESSAPETNPLEVTEPAPPTGSEGTTSPLFFSAHSLSQFWRNQSAPGAVKEVADPAGSGERVFQLTVNNADVYPITPTENPRAELISNPDITSGDEFWANMKFYLPSDFPSSVPSWLTVLEGPCGAPYGGTPPWTIEVSGTHLVWQRNATYNWDIPWQVNLVRGSWVHVMLHERFATDGWIEMWIDGKQITFFPGGTYNPNREPARTKMPMQTMDEGTNIGPDAFHVMNYRKLGMFESTTVLQGPLQIGATRASVES
jgi:hypothetical protein